MWSTFFPFSLAAGLFIQPHTICQQHLPSCTWQYRYIALHWLFSSVKQQHLQMSDRDNVSTRRELGSASLCPSSQTGLETWPRLSSRMIATCSARAAPAAGCCCSSPGRSSGLCLLPPLASSVTEQSPPPLLPCDTVMGCDMLFVGLVLVFCSPLTQQARPLQRRVAQSPFISALLFALPGERRRHLETDTGGTTSAKYPP